MVASYRPRVVDSALADMLQWSGAVLIVGPKWCGKTTTAEQAAKSVIYMDDPMKGKQNREAVELNPAYLLSGPFPRLIDEWQLAPRIWDAVRFDVDRRGEFGLYILTGSSVPPLEGQVFHSGAGRISRIVMRTMSLFESGVSSGQVSLGWLFDAPESISGESSLTVQDLAELICRGGWPQSVDLPASAASKQVASYIRAVAESDISRLDGRERNPDLVLRLLRSYARNQGQAVSVSRIAEDCFPGSDRSLNERTASSYMDALRRLFVLEDAPAWNPNLRSRTAIRSSDTRYFTDPSIGAAALGVGPGDLVDDLETLGFFFEGLCIRDLRIYAESLGGDVRHYRDKSGLECDAVIHRPDGSYGLIEIKLGGETAIDQAAINLERLSEKIDTQRTGAPSFLAVVTGVLPYAYRRPDRVYVIPISCLKN